MQHLEEDWQMTGILPPTRSTTPESIAPSGKALQVTSGNSQPSYNLEDIKAEEAKAQEGDAQVSLRIPQHHSYPAPPTLRSNVPPISAGQRLEQRRLHRAQVALRDGNARLGRRRCFNSRKYIEYRRRTRRDTGEDGQPIWPDELEEAFQEGTSNYTEPLHDLDG